MGHHRPGNNDHDFYVVVVDAKGNEEPAVYDQPAVLVHNCGPGDENIYDKYGDYENQYDGDGQSSQRMKPRSAGSSNQTENSFTDYLAQKYNLDEGQQRILHDAITGQHMPPAEIEDIA